MNPVIHDRRSATQPIPKLASFRQTCPASLAATRHPQIGFVPSPLLRPTFLPPPASKLASFRQLAPATRYREKDALDARP
ncbi:MAG: hypothetical protein ABI806_25455 [Candidatus Solibacter sp.]